MWITILKNTKSRRKVRMTLREKIELRKKEQKEMRKIKKRK